MLFLDIPKTQYGYIHYKDNAKKSSNNFVKNVNGNL